MSIKAGFVALSAAAIQDALGNLLPTGAVSFLPTDANDVPLNVPSGGAGGIITSATTATLAVTNGAIPAGSQIADTAQTGVANICYRITVNDSTGNPITVYRRVQTNGQPLNLDTYVSPQIAPQALQVAGPTGPVGPPANPRGNWSNATTYALGDSVYDTSTNLVYISLQAGNLNHDPSTSPAYWMNAGLGTTLATNITYGSHTPRTVDAKLSDVRSVKDYGAAGDGSTDDTAAIQAAFNDINSGAISQLYFPNGNYMLSAAITIAAGTITGVHVFGESRRGTQITQTANNTPIFYFTSVELHHTWDWDLFTFTWSTPQAGNSLSAVFYWTSTNNGNMYLQTFTRLLVSNCYWFMRGETVLYWGNVVRDVSCGTLGGFAYVGGNAGDPKCIFENIYITGGAAGQYLFAVNAVTAEYMVEVNNSPCGLIADSGGGCHIIRYFGLEVANFTTNTVLFNIPNGVLLGIGLMYAATLTIDAGIGVVAFAGGTGALPTATTYSRIGVKQFDFSIVSQGAGATFFLSEFYTNNNQKCSFEHVAYTNGDWPAYGALPNVALTDIGNTAAAECTEVVYWNDPNHRQVSTANTSLRFDSLRTNIVAQPLTAAIAFALPASGSSSCQNLFNGRAFDFYKYASAGTTYDMQVTDSSGNVLATIPAATVSAHIRYVFYRADPGGGSGLGNWVQEPV